MENVCMWHRRMCVCARHGTRTCKNTIEKWYIAFHFIPIEINTRNKARIKFVRNSHPTHQKSERLWKFIHFIPSPAQSTVSLFKGIGFESGSIVHLFDAYFRNCLSYMHNWDFLSCFEKFLWYEAGSRFWERKSNERLAHLIGTWSSVLFCLHLKIFLKDRLSILYTASVDIFAFYASPSNWQTWGSTL